MKLYVTLLLQIALLCPAILFSQSDLRIVDAVAAEVGGRRIMVDEVMEKAHQVLESEGIPESEQELKNRFPNAYSTALTNLINRQLILLRYEQGTKLPDWVFSRRIESVVEDHFGGDRSQLVSMLAKRGINYEKWRKNIEEDTIVSLMRQQFVDQGIRVRLEDIQTIYEKEYSTKKLSGPVRLGMIMLEPRGDQTISNVIDSANALVGKLRKGTNFSTAAKKYSSEPHASEGGDWGYIDPAESLREDLAAAATKLKTGEISDPIVIAGRYVYILKKIDEQKDLKISFEAARDEIENRLRSEMAEKRFNGWIKSLSDVTSVRVYKPTP